MCFLLRGQSHTWDPCPLWQWLFVQVGESVFFYSLRKIIWDHRRKLLTSENKTREWLQIADMCILQSWGLNSGSPIYH